jgi:hypothetical protein
MKQDPPTVAKEPIKHQAYSNNKESSFNTFNN